MSKLAYIDGSVVSDEVEEVCGPGTRFRNARYFVAPEQEQGTVVIGTPDASAEAFIHRQWAEIKAAYEEATEDNESAVSVEVEVVDALNPDTEDEDAEENLSDVVGTRQANALDDQGYGTLEAARTLSKDKLLALDGVGESTYDKLHEDEE